MFVDRIYPQWLGKLSYSRLWGWSSKPLSLGMDDARVKRRLVANISSDALPLPPGAKCQRFVALRRDGGALVKFSSPPGSSPKALVATIECNLQQ